MSVSLSLVSQEANPGQSLSRSELVGKINQVLRWKAFWEGVDSFKSRYVPGSYVDAKVIRTSKQIGVFIAAAGVNIVLHWDRQSGQFRPSFRSYTVGETNEAAVKRYVREEFRASGDADCASVSRTPAKQEGRRPDAGNILPAKRVCRDGNGTEVFTEENISLKLPILNAPPAARVPEAEINQLGRAIKKALEYYLDGPCPTASVTIARFSPDDPLVYVLVEFGQSCGRGILAAKRDSTGIWRAGKLFEDRPPNDLSRIIQQIRTSALEMFHLTAGG